MIARPAGCSVGMSFIEWTAMSIRPVASSASISRVKRPLPPSADSGRSCTLSPVVRMTTIAKAASGRPWAAISRSRASCAWARARGLPRVPMRSGRSGEGRSRGHSGQGFPFGSRSIRSRPPDGEGRRGNRMGGGGRMMRALAGEAQAVPPVWLMRQAGRYLPEYRATRAKAGSFLDLCYTPELAAEVTLQPIHRFGFDAAILFADILLVPQALGAELRFVEGEGPRLSPHRGRRRPRPAAAGRRDRRDPRPGLRDRPPAPRRAAGRRAADRLRRRAVDRRDLHGRRPRHPGPGPGARAALPRPGDLRRAPRPHHRGDDGLPPRPDRRRGAGGQALRLLGRRPPRPALRALCDRARPAHRRDAPRRASGGAGHRLSPRRGRALSRPMPRRRASTRSRSTRPSTLRGRRRRSSRAAASRGTSTRCCSSPAARPSSTPPGASSRPSPAAPTSSTSAMASRRTPIRATSSSSSAPSADSQTAPGPTPRGKAMETLSRIPPPAAVGAPHHGRPARAPARDRQAPRPSGRARWRAPRSPASAASRACSS